MDSIDVMDNERLFRAAIGALIVTAMTISGTFRRRAAKSGEKLPLREEGWPILILLRASAIGFFGTMLAYLVHPQWVSWATMPLPRWSRYLGLGIAAGVVPLLYWVLRSLGKNISPTVGVRAEHHLVTAGPYRWVRHPLYSFGTLFWFSLVWSAANWFLMGMGLVGLLMVALRTPIEEAKLLERYGDEYRAYMKRTGRFLPRPFA